MIDVAGVEGDAGRHVQSRFSQVIDRIERAYLGLLRVTALVLATLLLLAILWITISSLYNMSQSASSVRADNVSVSAEEILSIDDTGPKQKRVEATQRNDPAHTAYFRSFLTRYHALYRSKFEPFRQSEDKVIAASEFDDLYVGTSARLKAILESKTSFELERADLDGLLSTMTAAAELPQTIEALQRYKRAKKVAVTVNVPRTRTKTVTGWNRFSMNCPGWYNEPTGCSESRQVTEDYNERVTNMEYPKGTQTHGEIFGAYQTNYLQKLAERRERASADAEQKRASIIEGQARGQEGLVWALQLAAASLALMFLFLLIAIEKSFRRLSSCEENRVNVDAQAE